jgi:hypothetical protein
MNSHHNYGYNGSSSKKDFEWFVLSKSGLSWYSKSQYMYLETSDKATRVDILMYAVIDFYF